MSEIPCRQDNSLREKINAYAEVLKEEAHKLGDHGLSESEFYQSGLFRGAIERIRGQFSATMSPKREFIGHILNYLQDHGDIADWEHAGGANRHDYTIHMPDGRVSVIEAKGCLDGNNTIIFQRPSHAQEFVIWSLCTNTGGDPRRNVWSGVHTRLSAEIVDQETQVDGLVIWDYHCGTIGRRCPKIESGCPERLTEVGPYQLPPPCIYLLPSTVPTVRNNPCPRPNRLQEVAFLDALHRRFSGHDDELNYVKIEVAHRGVETVRKTTIERCGAIQRESSFAPIQRR